MGDDDDELPFGQKKQKIRKYGIKKDQTELFVKVKKIEEERTKRRMMKLQRYKITPSKLDGKQYKRSNSASLL